MKSLLLVILFFLSACFSSPPQQSLSDDNTEPPPTQHEEPEAASGSTSPGPFLLVGDSLSSGSGFAKKLVAFFRDPDAHCAGKTSQLELDVFSYAVPSASPRHFADESGANKDWLCKQKTVYRNETAKDTSGKELCRNTQGISVLNKLLIEHEPQAVIFELGTNSIGFSKEYLEEKVIKALDLISVRECIWIAPTMVSEAYTEKVRKTEQDLEEILQRHRPDCLYIKTFDDLIGQTECEKFNVSDGIHHTSCGSKLWADLVIKKICEN